MITMRDSRNKPSHTLGFAVLSWLAGTIVFIIAAIKGEFFLAEYGIFVGTTLAPYLFREHKEKSKNDNVTS